MHHRGVLLDGTGVGLLRMDVVHEGKPDAAPAALDLGDQRSHRNLVVEEDHAAVGSERGGKEIDVPDFPPGRSRETREPPLEIPIGEPGAQPDGGARRGARDGDGHHPQQSQRPNTSNVGSSPPESSKGRPDSAVSTVTVPTLFRPEGVRLRSLRSRRCAPSPAWMRAAAINKAASRNMKSESTASWTERPD